MGIKLLARQPIFDSDIRVVGYELLFRGEHVQMTGNPLGNFATGDVICNAFAAAANDQIFRGNAWINFTDGLIRDGSALLLPPRRVVIEVLEDVSVDEELLRSLRSLRAAGYTIALDDFEPGESNDTLVEIAHIAKLDVTCSEATLRRRVERLAGRVQLLAEKVETREVFEVCRQLGFTLYQGYFLGRPVLVEGDRVRAQRGNVLRLIAGLEGADMKWIKARFEQDPALSYKLLRILNSAALDLNVSTVERAVTLLGTTRIRRWLRLIALASLCDTPHELLRTTLVRAKMSELLAMSDGKKGADGYYLAGMLSLIDAMLNRPIPELLGQIPLDAEVKAALLEREGPMGAALDCAAACEEGGQPRFRELSTQSIQRCWIGSIQYADELMDSLYARSMA